MLLLLSSRFLLFLEHLADAAQIVRGRDAEGKLEGTDVCAVFLKPHWLAIFIIIFLLIFLVACRREILQNLNQNDTKYFLLIWGMIFV